MILLDKSKAVTDIFGDNSLELFGRIIVFIKTSASSAHKDLFEPFKRVMMVFFQRHKIPVGF